MFRLFTRLWKKELPDIASAAFLIGIASLASRLIGLLRDRLLASTFGAGDLLDAYYAAFRIPDLFYQLLILGAISSGFIPILAEYVSHRGSEAARELAEQMLSVLMTVLGIACILFAITAPWILPWTVPGFTGEKLALAVFLSRILCIATFFLGFSAVMGGVLQAYRRFAAFAFAPVFYNLGIIFGILFLVPFLGISGVVWGVVIGAAFHAGVQAAVAIPLQFRRIRFPSFSHEGIRRILRLTVPRIVALGALQLNLIVLLALASVGFSGSVTLFNLAYNVQWVPVGLIGVAFAVASFPTFSALAAQKRSEQLFYLLSDVLRKVFFLMLPMTAFLLLLRAQVIRILFGAGAFDWTATIRGADLLALFALSLIPQALSPIVTRAFYALQDTKTPLWISIASVAITLISAFPLFSLIGTAGLAGAFSLGALFQFGLLYGVFYHRMHYRWTRDAVWSIFKMIFATIVLFVCGWPVRQFVGTVYPLHTFWQVALQAGATIIAGGIGFSLTAYFLRIKEFYGLLSSMRTRLLRMSSVGEGADQSRGV